jgi:hypothetical protein
MSRRTIIFTLLILVALVSDVALAFYRVPVITLLVCAIVISYECISPYIYSSR